MPRCRVEATGKDGRIERIEVESTSVFDAGYQGLQRFALLLWWDSSKPITVRRDGAEWRVQPKRLSEWVGSAGCGEAMDASKIIFTTIPHSEFGDSELRRLPARDYTQKPSRHCL